VSPDVHLPRAPDECDVEVVVARCQIARAEPFAAKRLGGGFGSPPIAEHRNRTPYDDFTYGSGRDVVP